MKYRITGILVIVSLAIIFLPPLIGRNYIVERPVQVQVPPAPNLAKDLPKVDIKKVIEKAESEATPPKVIPPTVENTAWVLQVGSFKKLLNANRLVVDLRKDGYKSYMLEYGQPPNRLYRVMVGPDIHRDAIEQLKVKIKNEKGLSGVVMKYHPLLQAGASDELD